MLNQPLYTEADSQKPLTAANGSSEETTVSSGRNTKKIKSRVERVIDGDTIEIEKGIRVRLIGVDSPESVSPEAYRNTESGRLASDFTKARLTGKSIFLEKDISEKDKYGRLLRYVYLSDGTLFNELLVSEGMARAVTYKPDIREDKILKKAQKAAIKNKKGIWGSK